MTVQGGQVVAFQVYDVDIASEQYLCSGSFTIFEIQGSPREGFRIPLVSKGQDDGSMQFDVAWSDSNS